MITIRNIKIGEGIPKICAPIIENTQEEILDMAEKLALKKSVDIIEWRIDFYNNCFVIEKVIETASLIRTVVRDKPVLATFRTKNEGGEKPIDKEVYIKLLESLSECGYVDMIDVEAYFLKRQDTEKLAAVLKKHTIVVGSYHDFERTPSCEEIYERLKYMKEVGADIPKVACMPENKKDVFDLMSATEDFVSKNQATPVITMSMGELGKISRAAGKSFGSAVTFGCLGKASAPGQINVDDLRFILETI